MLGAGSVKVSWGGTPGGCAKKGEVLRGPEIIVHGGMGGPRVVQRSGERQEPNQGPGGRGSSMEEAGTQCPIPQPGTTDKSQESTFRMCGW